MEFSKQEGKSEETGRKLRGFTMGWVRGTQGRCENGIHNFSLEMC